MHCSLLLGLQSSSADKFNWQDFCPVSVLCPPRSHGLFPSYSNQKGQNYKEKYIYERKKVQMGFLHLILPCSWAGIGVPHSGFCKLGFPGIFPICRARMTLFSASLFWMSCKSKLSWNSLERNEAGSCWVIPEGGICRGIGRSWGFCCSGVTLTGWRWMFQ